MGQFFKFMFASMLGFILAIGTVLLVLFIIISVAVSTLISDKEVSVKDKSVLEITFNYPISERTTSDPFRNLNFRDLAASVDIGLNDIMKDIAHAKEDNHIKGILLHPSGFHTGLATLEEIRNALIDFKKSGKFIYAYADDYTQGTYYLASVADKIYMNPEGSMEIKGFAANMPFFKGTLEKLGIEPEVIRHGKYKSAVEPFILDKMSPENREQTRKYIDELWGHYIASVAKSRNISTEELQKDADELLIQTPQDAVNRRLIDHLAYYDEVLNTLRQKTGTAAKDKVSLVELKKYDRSFTKTESYSLKKVAVIYAVGEITSGKGDEEQIGSEKMAETIRKARMDSSIKAIVLRVNSPGGSALASEVIWREMALARKVKPVVVSMGDVAASGGYYISCAADTIVAQPNTITGSTSVFGLRMSTRKLFNDKLGVTFDTVKTGQYADIGNSTRPMMPAERNAIQNEVERIYATFITHVGEGRHLDTATVDEMGQGRVWSGTDAKRLNLVDVLGGINDAVAIVARMAKLDKYRTVALPEQKENIIGKYIENLSDEAQTSMIRKELGESYDYYKQLNRVRNMTGVRAELMYYFGVE